MKNYFKIIKEFTEICWYRSIDFFKDFVFPGRLFWRMLLCPANKLRIPQLKSWGYCDPRELMVYANMQVLEQFWKENPEELVCWKVDEDGKDIGPRIKSTLFPEINGMYAIDVIHMADDIFKKEIPQLNKQLEFMYDLMMLISPKMLLKDKEGNIGSMKDINGPATIIRDYSSVPKSIDENVLEDEGFTEDAMNVFHEKFGKSLKRARLNEKKIHKMIWNMEEELETLKNKAIHYLTEARIFMWI